MKNEINEKTKLNLPITALIILISFIFSAGVWIATLQATISPMKIQVKANTEKIDTMYMHQFSLCLATKQIQKYNVPKHAQQDINCEVK